MNMILRAAAFATHAHGDQLRKLPGGGSEPYMCHPGRVAGMMLSSPEGRSELGVSVALLHDVVEDTKVTLEDIRKEFGESVAIGVDLLTDPELDFGNRAYRKAHVRERLATAAPPFIKRIKLFDCLDNLRSMAPDTHKPEFLKLCIQEMRELVTAIGGSPNVDAAVAVLQATNHLESVVGGQVDA